MPMFFTNFMHMFTEILIADKHSFVSGHMAKGKKAVPNNRVKPS